MNNQLSHRNNHSDGGMRIASSLKVGPVVNSDVCFLLACNPSFPKQVSRFIFESLVLEKASTEVRAFVAKSIDTPSFILRRLAFDADVEIRCHVAGNESTPSDMLDELSNVSSSAVQSQLARNPSTPMACLKRLALSGYSREVLNNKTPQFKHLRDEISDSLERQFEAGIAQLKNGVQRPALSRNDNLLNVLRNAFASASIIERYFYDVSASRPADVRWIISHANTPASILMKFERYDDPSVRKMLALNKNTPPQSLVKITDITEERIDIWSDSAIDNFFLEQECELMEYIGENPNVPVAILNKFTMSKDSFGSSGVAKNIKSPAAILAKLAADPDSHTRTSVAKNPSTPPHVLDELANDIEPIVRASVAGRMDTSRATLNILCGDLDDGVRSAVAANESTPIAALDLLSKDKSIKVVEKIAQNPIASTAILSRLSWHVDASIRRCVARHGNSSSEILVKLINDCDMACAYAALTNRNLSEKELARLVACAGIIGWDI